MAYDAFMSYSHAADGLVAPALQRGLQRLAKPWNRRRALSVFRDETGLSANPHLWSSIAEAIDASEWFVLLASPEAASSDWVNDELSHWLTTKSAERVLVVLTDGEWSWDATTRDLSAGANAIPPALYGAFRDEPRHLDLRWARDDHDLDLRNSRFRDAVADLAAPLHGVAKDELESEDIRQHRHARRLVRAATSLLAGLLVLSLCFGAYAIAQRNDARRQRSISRIETRLATVRGLMAEAGTLSGRQLDLALLLAASARRVDDSAETRATLFATVQRSPHLVRMFRSPTAIVAGAVSPDGNHLALVDDRGELVLRRSSGPGHGPTIATGHVGRVNRVVFGPGGRVATAGDDGSVRLFDARTGDARSQVLRDPGSSQPVSDAVFSPDGSKLAAISGWGDLLIWNVATGTLVKRFRRDHFVDTSRPRIGFSPDGAQVVVSARPTEVYDLNTGHVRTFVGVPAPGDTNTAHPGATTSGIAFRPDGGEMAISSEQAISFHDAATGLETRRYGVGAVALAYSPDGSRLYAAQPDGTIKVLAADRRGDTSEAAVVSDTFVGHSSTVMSLAFSDDSKELFTAARGEVGIWNLAEPALENATLPGPRSGANDVAFSPDGKVIAASRIDGTVTTWRADRGRRVARTVRITGQTPDSIGATGIAFSPDGGRLAVGGWDGTVTILDAHTLKRVRPPVAVTSGPSTDGAVTLLNGIYQVGFSPDGTVIAAGVGNGTVVLLNSRTGEIERRLSTGHTGVTLTIAFSPDGKLLAAGNTYFGDQTGATVFEMRTGRIVWSYGAGSSGVGGVAFSPDGRVLAVGLFSGATLRIDTNRWKASGAPLVANRGLVLGIAFSPDGHELAEGTETGTSLLWDLRTQPPTVSELGRAKDRVVGIAFSPDGRSVVSASSDSSVTVWNVDADAWTRRACVMAGRNLTRSEWTQYLGDQPYEVSCPPSAITSRTRAG